MNLADIFGITEMQGTLQQQVYKFQVDLKNAYMLLVALLVIIIAIMLWKD